MLAKEWLPIAVALTLGAVGCGALVRAGGRLRGTTLTQPRGWAIGAIGFLVASEVLVGLLEADRQPGWVEAIRYAAATATLCPLMALLGARRPQHRAWQMIVLSFWAVVQVPSLQWLLMRSGEPLHLFPAWSWFLAILLFVALVNHLPTRFATAALLALAGQLTILAPYLPLVALWTADWAGGATRPLVGTALLVAAILSATYQPRRSDDLRPLDRLWLDFRDLYGTVWALRVAAEVNSSSAMHGRNMTLTWDGFCPSGDSHDPSNEAPTPPDAAHAVERSLRSHVGRFVSTEWMDKRLKPR